MRRFRVGITPDFYVDAKGRFEKTVAEKLSGMPDLDWGPMPAQPGKLATPEALDQFDAILALGLRITAESLRGVERLALVARWGVGYDMLDVPALTQADIALAITPNAVRGPVAEAILALIFALSKNLLEQDRLIRHGKWRGDLSRLGCSIKGKTLGSLGCGNIAREMFRRAASLGFGRFLAYDPYVEASTVAELGIEMVSVEALFRESDYLAVNTLLNGSTRGIVGERFLRLMKPTAFLINTARGSIVDQKALTRALQEHWIAGAGLDVFEREPVDPTEPMLQLDNVVLAPHGLAWTTELAHDNSVEACDHILSAARGEIPDGVVNREVLDRPGFQRKLTGYRDAAIRESGAALAQPHI